MQPTQADSEIEEEHLLNFVVNSLDEELAIDLGEDVARRSGKFYYSTRVRRKFSKQSGQCLGEA